MLNRERRQMGIRNEVPNRPRQGKELTNDLGVAVRRC